IAEGGMQSLLVVNVVDEVLDSRFSFLEHSIVFAVHLFVLQSLEERLAHGIGSNRQLRLPETVGVDVSESLTHFIRGSVGSSSSLTISKTGVSTESSSIGKDSIWSRFRPVGPISLRKTQSCSWRHGVRCFAP